VAIIRQCLLKEVLRASAAPLRWVAAQQFASSESHRPHACTRAQPRTPSLPHAAQGSPFLFRPRCWRRAWHARNALLRCVTLTGTARPYDMKQQTPWKLEAGSWTDLEAGSLSDLEAGSWSDLDPGRRARASSDLVLDQVLPHRPRRRRRAQTTSVLDAITRTSDSLSLSLSVTPPTRSGPESSGPGGVRRLLGPAASATARVRRRRCRLRLSVRGASHCRRAAEFLRADTGGAATCQRADHQPVDLDWSWDSHLPLQRSAQQVNT